ncbi:hypothetical protein CITFRE_37090 [Citrobacter freundii]|nr:hypothetical protein CITFRE_37090 [Citrobacter freundii]
MSAVSEEGKFDKRMYELRKDKVFTTTLLPNDVMVETTHATLTTVVPINEMASTQYNSTSILRHLSRQRYR